MLGVAVLRLLGPLDEGRAAGFLRRPGPPRRLTASRTRWSVRRWSRGLSAEEQRRLHTAAADAIEALYEGQLRLHLAEVARHRIEASLPGDRARAVAAREAAASVAACALAFEEAVRLYRQALAAGEGELGEDDRSLAPARPGRGVSRSGDLPGSQQTAAQVGGGADGGATGSDWRAPPW